MFIKYIPPSPFLKDYIKTYQILKWEFLETEQPPLKFLAPRPEHSLTFYIRDPQYFSFLKADTEEKYPPCILSGMYTDTLIRDCGKNFWAIKIIFEHTALYRILGMPMQRLTNNFIEGELVFGKQIKLLNSRINSSNNIVDIITLIEDYLKQLIKNCKKKVLLPIDEFAYSLNSLSNLSNIETMAAKCYLSPRQFIRKFEERIGVSPKLFSKIVRFDYAYKLKNNQPNLDWLSISIKSGYYDYQHLSKDYKAFTSFTPIEYYEIDKKGPERKFGLHFG